LFLGIVSSIIKTWIKNKGSGSVVNDEEFLAALREFKYKTDRRLANLEEIVTDENPETLSKKRKAREEIENKKENLNEKKQSSVIEIEEKKEKESSEKSGKNKGGNLRNMLKQ